MDIQSSFIRETYLLEIGSEGGPGVVMSKGKSLYISNEVSYLVRAGGMRKDP